MDNIISGLIGLVGAIIGAIASYVGVKQQIKYQAKQSEKEMILQIQVAIGIISRFLWKEVEYNCQTLDGAGCIFSKDIFLKDTPSQFGHSNTVIKFQEFDKVKFELLKYKSRLVIDIFDIYDKFYILSIHRDIKELTSEEFNWVKTIYNDKEEIRKEIDRNFKMTQIKSS